MPIQSTVERTMLVDAAMIPTSHDDHHEVIAGYTLQRQIGSGGYGEVWRAVGPGGLPKAVKILHGRFDGVRADTELKSLQLMRELRHPFLLNVERIETVDGRLIIVTELAEGSLEDRFEHFRQQGGKGIPRDELLTYLQDAADALDYMYEQHGLQHLDIKPGNLLFQGGHVKVADFGLIKNLNQTNVSMISGFTPLYAPPELFDGRPSHGSDQYSLAIVYQVMLTGVPPFAGRTAAQLTAQHLSSKPDLSALLPADHAAVARALSKSAQARFPSCREFVDRLSQRRLVKSRSSVTPADRTSRPAGDASPCGVPRPKTEPIVPKIEAVPLSALDVGGSQVTYRPTLFLGIGGLAGAVLRCLRRRLTVRCGHGQPLSALPFLYIDTDQHAIAAVHDDELGMGLNRDETLPIPLRDRNNYRTAANDLLQWLSRRWLFNMPRSGQVEGLRPLGRLAFVDHQREIRERLRHLLSAATLDASVQQTGRDLGLRFGNEPPEVFVIASLGGGTGSGAVLDAAYLVRDVFKTLAIEPGPVSGLLLQATNGREQVQSLQKANAISCLKELDYFGNPHIGYPGDIACQLSQCDQPPFDHAYLVQMGDGLSDLEFAAEIEKVAEYLYCNAATPAREFFNKCRISEREARPSPRRVPLRTFGLATVDQLANSQTHLEAAALGLGFLHKCSEILGRNASNAQAGMPLQTPDLLRPLQLDAEHLSEQALAIVGGEMGLNVEAYFRSKLANLTSLPAGQRPLFDSLRQDIDREFAPTSTNKPSEGLPAHVMAKVREQLATWARQAAETLRANILAASSRSQLGLVADFELVLDTILRLGETEVGLSQLCGKFEHDLNNLHRQASDHDRSAANRTGTELPGDKVDPLTLYLRYAMVRLCSSVLRALVDHVIEIRQSLEQTAAAWRTHFRDWKDRFRLDLEQQLHRAAAMAQKETLAAACNGPHLPTDSDVQAFAAQLSCERAVQLADFVSLAQPPERFPEIVRKKALAFLLEHAPSGSPREAQHSVLSSRRRPLEELVAPRLRDVGGGRRVLALLPESASSAGWTSPLRDNFGACVARLDERGAEHFLCCEVEGIELVSAISFLTQQNDSLTEMASRIHTRIDVSWSQLA